MWVFWLGYCNVARFVEGMKGLMFGGGGCVE